MSDTQKTTPTDEMTEPQPSGAEALSEVENLAEIGGPAGPEPTRFGDWERKGRCIDF